MKIISVIVLLIFICSCMADDSAADTDQEKSPKTDYYHDYLEKYNCLTYRYRPKKTCESVGGECIPGCPPVIRHYDTTTCECGTTCCVWLF